MGSLKNALRKLGSGAPKLDFYKHKHGECQNLEGGTCKVAHFTNLKADETACPHFKPRPDTEA
ncbi:MAG: hypothetical protein NWE93_04545 [Candidatus Bathyarchaeota archaeon]|nr:hypothetical protein [Candidatus Bathyarchaeota archaeon]